MANAMLYPVSNIRAHINKRPPHETYFYLFVHLLLFAPMVVFASFTLCVMDMDPFSSELSVTESARRVSLCQFRNQIKGFPKKGQFSSKTIYYRTKRPPGAWLGRAAVVDYGK